MPRKWRGSKLRPWHVTLGLCLVAGGGLLLGRGLAAVPWETLPFYADLYPKVFPAAQVDWTATTATEGTQFFAVAGGGAPNYNEIALEKNVLYFQRTLAELGHDPAEADVLFANGTDGRPTIRYLDEQTGRERYKVPDIPHLRGAATWPNLVGWFEQAALKPNADDTCPVFFYFTGHGALNEANSGNNALILWQEDLLSVQTFASLLDALPPEQPFVTMMAQCYSGSFANLIYRGGDPDNPVALQTRCGFFATVESRPSVGCTPLVNEADYEDYSSSFFAGLSGRDRIGQPVATADYNRDGSVSFAEAHAFAKVDAHTPDWPISTSEAWLQRQASPSAVQTILSQPMHQWLRLARPEQRYVIESLATALALDLNRSFQDQQARLGLKDEVDFDSEASIQQALAKRLEMELITIGMADRIQTSGDPQQVRILNQMLDCEAGHWR